MNRLAWLPIACIACAACGGDDGGGDAADTPDAAAPSPDAAVLPPDASSPLGVLFINEVMPSNAAACADPFGEFDDWVELYNAGATDLDLTGFTVTDDTTTPAKATLTGVTVPAHGYKLLWCDGQVQGVDHLSFKLEAKGEQFAIYLPDGSLIDSITFGKATTDVSFARVPDGTGDFASCAHATCGAANGTTCTAGQ